MIEFGILDIEPGTVVVKGYAGQDISQVTIPPSVQAIEAKAFKGCNDLWKVEFTGDSRLSAIGPEAFRDCLHLEKINLPASLKEIGDRAFEDCQSLQSVDFPGLVSMGDRAFATVLALRQINLPNTLKHIGKEAFHFAALHAGALRIPASAVNEEGGLGYAVFQNSGITGVDLPIGLTKIDESLFEFCRKLEGEVIIPDGVTEIGRSAFNDDKKLRRVLLPEGLEKIGEFAFASCEALESINIPASVKQIDFFAFTGCKNLVIRFEGDINDVDIGIGAFDKGPTVMDIQGSVRRVGYRHRALV